MNLETITHDRYHVRALTQSITKRQNEYGLLNGLGIFREEGITTRHVEIETKKTSLNIIPSSPIGSPTPAEDAPSEGDIRMQKTFRHAKKYTVMAEELQSVRAFGTDNEVESFDGKVLEKLDLAQREHRQTKEYLRWQALRGNVYDPDGTRVLFNTYSLMGETQKAIDWDLADDDSVDPILDASNELHDYFEDEALGEVIGGAVMFCSSGFHEKLMKNKSFREAYKYYDASLGGELNPTRQTGRKPFEYKDVIYIRHRGKCSFKKADGTIVTHDFIPTDEAIAIPLGTSETFRTFFSPGEFAETVNTQGLEIYAKADPHKLNTGIDIHTFSYQLNIVTKPRLVVRCKLPA